MNLEEINTNSVALMSRTLQKDFSREDQTFGEIIIAQKPVALQKDEDIVSVPALRIQDKRVN